MLKCKSCLDYQTLGTLPYMLFQNDVPINVAVNGSDLNMQICSGAQDNSTAKEQSCTTVMISFNDVVLVATGTWRFPYESPM